MANREIGVVIPTWNSAATLDWTLCSLRHQKDCSVLIMVSDSGSTDGTLEICKRWDVPTVYEPPGSMYRAINAGTRQLKTAWLAYVNSDDYMFTDAYTRLIDRGESEKADVVYGGVDFMDEAGRFIFSYGAAPTRMLPWLMRYGISGVPQPSAIYRHEVFESLNGYRADFRHISDFDFYRRAAAAGRKFATVPSPSVTAFRLMPGQLHQRESDVVKREIQVLIDAGQVQPLTWYPKLRWRLYNLPTYVVRYLRQGTLKMR